MACNLQTLSKGCAVRGYGLCKTLMPAIKPAVARVFRHPPLVRRGGGEISAPQSITREPIAAARRARRHTTAGDETHRIFAVFGLSQNKYQKEIQKKAPENQIQKLFLLEKKIQIIYLFWNDHCELSSEREVYLMRRMQHIRVDAFRHRPYQHSFQK